MSTRNQIVIVSEESLFGHGIELNRVFSLEENKNIESFENLTEREFIDGKTFKETFFEEI